MSKANIRHLKEQYEKACNAWLSQLLDNWNLSYKDGFWVSDEVGGVYFHEADFSLNMDEIIFCVENDVTLDKYWEFLEYIQRCEKYNFKIPKLQSYIKGCSTVPQETFDKLDAMRTELDKCIEETKNQF